MPADCHLQKHEKDRYEDVPAFLGEGISFYWGVAKNIKCIGDLHELLYP